MSAQGYSMIKPDMLNILLNIYWTKTKLPAAANQAIYIVIFHWVVGTSYMSLLMLLLYLCMGFYEKGRVSLELYAHTFFSTEKVRDASSSSPADLRPFIQKLERCGPHQFVIFTDKKP